MFQGPWFPLRGRRFPLEALGSPDGALYCLIVGHSLGFDCIGPRGASRIWVSVRPSDFHPDPRGSKKGVLTSPTLKNPTRKGHGHQTIRE